VRLRTTTTTTAIAVVVSFEYKAAAAGMMLRLVTGVRVHGRRHGHRVDAAGAEGSSDAAYFKRL
jgi:hypothetical protein